MAIAYLLGWWYGSGWLWLARGIQKQIRVINETFSVGILLKTWFAPWKQIQSPSNFRNFLQTSIDNFISRFIGATVRTVMILAACVLTFLVAAGGLVALICWPFVPILVIALPVAWLGKVEL